MTKKTNGQLLPNGIFTFAMLAVTGGCSHVMGRTTLTDGNVLEVEGYGTSASLDVKCLSEVQIKQLTGSLVDPTVPRSTCYTVIFITSRSSQISRAITSYVNAESELAAKVAEIAAPNAPPISSADPVAQLANKLAAEVIDRPGAEIEQEVAGLSENLTTELKAALKARLAELAKAAEATSVQNNFRVASESVR
jgi:hypothetical protein